MPKSVIKFSEIDKDDILLVGENGTSLGEMVSAGIPVSDGFVITTYAYHEFVKENKLDVKIRHLLSTADFGNEKSLQKTSSSIRKHIREGKLSQNFIKEVISFYNHLGKSGISEYPQVTITPSEVLADLTNDVFFDIKGDAVLLEKIKESWASYFDAKALFRRLLQKQDNSKNGAALIVQKTVEENAFASGLMFTVNQVTNDKTKILIRAVYGLHELLGINKEISDLYEVNKYNFAVLNRRISLQKKQLKKTRNITKEIKIAKTIGSVQKITDQQIVKLAKFGLTLEKKYYFPQEIEWIIQNNEIYITKTKQLTANPEEKLVQPTEIKSKIVSDYFDIPASVKINNQTVNLKTATKLYVNLNGSEKIADIASKNVDGVGLLRAESMLTGIGIHPKKMLRNGKQQELINLLANNTANVCKAFGEKPVIYRVSNLQTHEYRHLSGGNEFEPQETNPALGFRGALRYINDPEVFELELEAIEKVRNEMGYQNLWLMIPFVRTPEELVAVKKILEKNNLLQSANFKLWIMLEIPSNVIMLEKLIEVGIDGILINSDNLTMLITGNDSNDSETASNFNQTDSAVLWAFEHIVKTANKHGLFSSICGQAVSSDPELIRNLVYWGISGITILPDEIQRTRKLLAQTEKELLNHR